MSYANCPHCTVLRLKTAPETMAYLVEAAKRAMTAAELREQEVSFIFGQVGGGITKATIREILKEPTR